MVSFCSMVASYLHLVSMHGIVTLSRTLRDCGYLDSIVRIGEHLSTNTKEIQEA
jgi:hypothetical protein